MVDVEFNSTVQTVSWFRDRYLEGTLTLKPSYQRNAVWRERQKSWLVESVLKKLPVPEVFVQATTDDEGRDQFSVVDGQQRIRALLQFVGAENDDDQVDFDSFSLNTLAADSPWYGAAFNDLEPAERRAFFGYTISVRMLVSDDEEEIKEMFRRLNKFTAPLKPQELRNATYGGPFARLATRLADDFGDYLAERKIIGAEAIRRMYDVEFMAELMIGALHGPQGGQARVIDSYYETYEDFESEFPREREVRALIPRALNTADVLVPNLKETRWSNKSDFYSLITAIAVALRAGSLDESALQEARTRLSGFATEVDARIENDNAQVSDAAGEYVRNVIRGANEKARRAVRHASLLGVLVPSTDGAAA